MSVKTITFEEARRIVLRKLREWRDSLPKEQRTLPFVIWKEAVLSPNDMIREVELNTELGRMIVVAEIRKLGYERVI